MPKVSMNDSEVPTALSDRSHPLAHLLEKELLAAKHLWEFCDGRVDSSTRQPVLENASFCVISENPSQAPSV